MKSLHMIFIALQLLSPVFALAGTDSCPGILDDGREQIGYELRGVSNALFDNLTLVIKESRSDVMIPLKKQGHLPLLGYRYTGSSKAFGFGWNVQVDVDLISELGFDVTVTATPGWFKKAFQGYDFCHQ